MKFVVERDELRRALDVASLALKDSSREPIYSHFLVDIQSNNKARIKANDKFLFCESSFHLLEGDEGSLTLPGSALKDLAKLADEGTIVFQTAGDDTVSVSSGKAKLSFLTLPTTEFLEPQDNLAEVPSETYSVSHLTEALKYMKSFIGQDKDRLEYMVTELRNGHWMASDGVKIGMYERPGFEGNVIIQTKALNPVLNFLKNSEQDAVVVSSTEQFVWLNDGESKLAFRRDDRSFPVEIEEALSVLEPQDHVKINRDYLERIVQRLKIALEGGNTRMEFSLTGDEEGELEVKTLNSKGKASVESLYVRREQGAGNDVGFALDWRPLLDTLQSDPFSEGLLDLYYIPSKNIVKLARDVEGLHAVSLIALRP